MRKIAICMTMVILLFHLAGCGKAADAEVSPAGWEENNTVQPETEVEEKDMTVQPEIEAEKKDMTVQPETEAEEKDMTGQPGTEPENSGHEETDSPKHEELSATGETDNKEEKPMKVSVKSAEYEIIYELNDSQAAKDLYAQLPLTMEVEPFSSNEMTFYPPEKLNTANTPLSGGETGSLSYYSPWGDVVMFYAPCDPNGSLYELGTVISGRENIEKLGGTIEVTACD